MNIYNDYLNRIESALKVGKRGSYVNESLDHFDRDIRKAFTHVDLSAYHMGDDSLLPSLQKFASEMGLSADFNQKLGQHPDFAYLKGSSKTEKHYIVSAFIDIKGSTNLFHRYEPETVLVINDTIQKAAIHTCLIFGGYIHRLHGDGLFVYYGGKKTTKADAVEKALLSSSIFTYFVKNDLKEVFDTRGIDQVFTRIGIDLGHEDDVIWSSAGIGEISEVTTCSLHTSLASKMQSNATSNGIVVGDYVKDVAGRNQDFITPVCHRTSNENDRYIFEIPDEGFRYTQYDFDWLKFLKRQDFFATDLQGRLSFKEAANYQVRHSNNLRPIAIKSTPFWNF